MILMLHRPISYFKKLSITFRLLISNYNTLNNIVLICEGGQRETKSTDYVVGIAYFQNYLSISNHYELIFIRSNIA